MIRILLILVLTSFKLSAQTVYKTPSGAKYHLATCRMVENVSAAVSLSKAAEMGLEPCKICKPSPATSQSLTNNKAQGRSTNTTQCLGMTQAGNRCKHMTSIANGYCYQHQPK